MGTIFFHIQQVWYHICFVLGLSGNLFVLHGSIVHKAIKLDDMSLWIIKNLAVTDILNCVLFVLPMLITQYAGNIWIMGDTLCKLSAIFRWTFGSANAFLINALSINKLHRCVFPLKSLMPSKRRKVLVTVSTILFCLISPSFIGARLMHVSADVLFHPSRSNCEQTGSHLMVIDKIVLLSTGFVLPNLLLVVTNAVLLGYAAKKTNTRLNKLNVLIVILVTASYLLSSLPSFIVLGMGVNGTPRDFAWSIMFLSAWINPPIYVAVNSQFKAYTQDRIIFWKRNKDQVIVAPAPPSRGQQRR